MSGRTIGQLAREASVNVETIRFYERRGLIPQPQAVDGRWRHYGDETVFLLRFIKLMQSLGFSLREIQGLLAPLPDTEAFCEAAREATESKIVQLQADIRGLSKIREVLQSQLESCRGGETCPAWRLFAGEFS